MRSIDDLAIGKHGANVGPVTFLPEPEARPREFVLVSVDDHLVEPPDTFDGRMPGKYAESGPRVIEQPDGSQVWLFEDRVIPNSGTNAVVGRPPREYSTEPSRFDHMRKGAYDVQARVADMDLGGIWASVCFPSKVAGFAGARFAETEDPELGLAAMRAWNDWHLEAWCGAYPDRFIPQQVTWLRDPVLAAEEIRRNAARGFKSLSFPENPAKLGLPSIHSGYWDPVMAACAETGTPVSLHVGSASEITTTTPDAPAEVATTLFFAGAIMTTTDWLFSKIPVRFPDIKIVMSEGGIGWVPSLTDRINHCFRYREYTGGWIEEPLHPVDVLERNFWFCALDDTAGFAQLDAIGAARVLVECDYPHADSSWPDTQATFRRQFAGLSPDTIDKVCWRNATDVYGFVLTPTALDGSWLRAVAKGLDAP